MFLFRRLWSGKEQLIGIFSGFFSSYIRVFCGFYFRKKEWRIYIAYIALEEFYLSTSLYLYTQLGIYFRVRGSDE